MSHRCFWLCGRGTLETSMGGEEPARLDDVSLRGRK
jgi:hypothetical protein